MTKVLKVIPLLLALVLLASVPAVISAKTENSSGALRTTVGQVAPSVSATASPGAQVRLNSPVSVTVTFSEPVSGFTVDDITVVNGTASSFSGSDGDAVYTFDVTPNSLGEVTVDIAAGVATDSDGAGNTPAPRLSLGIPYDFDGNGGISRAETIAAIRDYFGGNITRAQAIAVIRLYFSAPTGPGPGPSDDCIQTVSSDGTLNGQWAGGCESETRSGSHARYYTFTLDASSEVTVRLESSSANTYLYLRRGDATSGTALHENDDHDGTTTSQITATLAAGAYTIEATTYSAGETGTFSLNLALMGTPTTPGTVAGDRAALVAFYNATGGPNWANNTGWLTDAPLGQWYGVTTDDGGRVTELILNDNGLSGSIPAVLGNLSSLKVLNLANPLRSCNRSPGQRWVCTSGLTAPNRLTGAIPADLARLANLEQLVLGGNQLSGTIPAWLGNLSKLERLSLQGNQLTGTIPADLGRLTNLRFLRLSFNPMDENTPLPAWLTSLSHLMQIELNGLDLTGAVPPGLARLTNLNIVGLSENQLTGEIPPQLGQLTRLRSLNLGNNSLAGPIPPELGSISTLHNLYLQGNRLSGSIPSELGNLSNLRTLRLVGNNLSGCVPSALQNVPTNDFDRLGLPFCAP